MGLMRDYPINHQALSMEHHLERLSLESNYVANMVSQFQTAIPSFISNLKSVNLNLFELQKKNEANVDDLVRNQRKVIERLAVADYLNFAELQISVPENFKGSFHAYAEFLNKISVQVGNVESQVLKEYNIMLSSFITNKEDKHALKDHTQFYKKIDGNRAQVLLDIQRYFPNNTGITKARLIDVLPRGRDMEALLLEVYSLNRTHAKTNLKNIQHHVQECTDLLDIIIDGVEKKTIENIGPNAVMNISKGAYSVGKYVELTSIIYFDIEVFLNCVNRMVSGILNIKK